jgi:hypothetical protein
MMTPAKFFACALLTLLATSVLAMSLSARSAYAVDDLWYPGEGVKQDMFLKYRVQEHDTNNNRSFEMTIYFKEQVDGDWIAPAFVVDQGRVINGTLKLAANMQALSGGGGVPPEMSTYISAYHGSLHWLDAFTTKNEPLSLTAGSWGKTGSIGGSEIRPSGSERISFAGAQDVCQAESCDTTLIQWHKGVDSKIWIVNEFPFPVEALTYVDVTTGNAPIQFAFELLETGTGQPEVPGSVTEVPTPPLGPKATDRGTYEIELDWDPAEIRPDGAVVFGVTMTDSTGFPLERVNYNLEIKDSSGNMVQEFRNQNAELGVATHEVTFNTSGPMTVTVTLNSISGAPAGGGTFTEAVDFGIVVVPEFPVSVAIIAGVIVGIVALMTRARSTGFGLFGKNKAL